MSAAYSVLLAVDALAKDKRKVRPSHLVLASALGVCWERLRLRVPLEGDVLEHGARVIDVLLDPLIKLAPGDVAATMLDVVRAGSAALEVLSASVPSLDGIERQAVFAAAPSDDSSASDSPSSADGGSNQAG
jgi:hypothetical protein